MKLLLLLLALSFSRPDYEFPNVQAAMLSIYRVEGCGLFKTESSFVIHGRNVYGIPIVQRMTHDHEWMKETVDLMPGDTAIVHTHPRASVPYPSQHDIDVADKYGIDMYTVSFEGVWLYRKGMKRPIVVITDKEMNKWLKH